jgi:hypothetical protein
MSTTVKLCKEDVVLVSDRNSQGDLVASQVKLLAVADIIDTEQNVSAAAGAGAEVGVPNLDGGLAQPLLSNRAHDKCGQCTSEQKTLCARVLENLHTCQNGKSNYLQVATPQEGLCTIIKSREESGGWSECSAIDVQRGSHLVATEA